MALAKYGGVISELRGKEGGVIFSRNAYGSYMKQKVTPVNPQTAKQLAQRSWMGGISQAWAGLSEADKTSWNNLGEQVTRVNVFGDTTYYTGFNIYVKLNRNLLLAGDSALDTAPVIDTPEAPTATGLTIVSGVPAISLAFTPTVPSGVYMFVYATNNILTGRSFVKNYYRLVAIVDPAATSPEDIYTAWNDYFSNLLVLGAKVFVKIKNVKQNKGWESVPSTVSAVITAS